MQGVHPPLIPINDAKCGEMTEFSRKFYQNESAEVLRLGTPRMTQPSPQVWLSLVAVRMGS